MFKKYRIALFGIGLMLISLITICMMRPILAQSPDNPNVFVVADNTHKFSFVSIAPGNPNPNILYQLTWAHPTDIFRVPFISPDGQWMYSSSTADQATVGGKYGRVGASLVDLPMTGNYFSFRFSADSRYLVFVTANRVKSEQSLSFLNLADAHRIEFTAKFDDRPQSPNDVDFHGFIVAGAEGWRAGDKHMLVISVDPFGRPGTHLAFYSLDLTGIDFSQSGQYAMPPLKQIAGNQQYIGGYDVSPDGRKLAYIYVDNAKLRAGFDRSKAGPETVTSNSIAVIDLASGNIETINASSQNHIVQLAWYPDGKSLLYTEGDSSQTPTQYYPYQYNLVAHQATQFTALSVNGTIQSLKVCGSNLFYIADNKLYSTSLADTSNSTPLLTDVHVLYIVGCAPAEAWQAAKISTLEPAPTLTPTSSIPVVGRNADITKLDLTGGDAVAGQKLYAQFTCAACHDAPGSAAFPFAPTAGTYTRIVNLQLKDPANQGLTAEQYIAQSILNPNKYVVPGAPSDIMPGSYGDQLRLEELRDLIAYTKTLE